MRRPSFASVFAERRPDPGQRVERRLERARAAVAARPRPRAGGPAPAKRARARRPGRDTGPARHSGSSNQKKPTVPGPACVPTTGAERRRDLDLRVRPACADELAQRLEPLGRRRRARCPTRSAGASVVACLERRRGAPGTPCWLPRTRLTGTTSPSRIARIGLMFSSVPGERGAPGRSGRPCARYSSVSTVNSEPGLAPVALDERVDLLVGRARARAGAGSRARASRSPPTRCRESITRTRAAALELGRRARALDRARRASPEMCSDEDPLVGARAPRRRRGSRPASAARSSAARGARAAARRTRPASSST